MVPVTSLWLPIIASAVVVFLVSFITHMVLKYHRNDFGKMGNEDGVLDAIRKSGAGAGEYMMPSHPGGADAMKDPVWLEKMKRGPVAIITLRTPGDIGFGKSLAQWFVFLLVVNTFAGYVAGVALGPGVDYLAVFRIVGTVAFVGYGLGAWQTYIWSSKPLRNVLLANMDGLIYALFAAGTFGWLWPK